MADAARQADLRRYAYLYNGAASRPARRGIGLQNRLTNLVPDTDGEVGPTNDAPQVPADAPALAPASVAAAPAELHNNAMGTGGEDVSLYDSLREAGYDHDEATRGVRDYENALHGERNRQETAREDAAERERMAPPSPASDDFDPRASGSGEHVTHMGDNYYAPVNVSVRIRDAQVEGARNYAAEAMGYITAQTRAVRTPLPDDEVLEEGPTPYSRVRSLIAEINGRVARARQHTRAPAPVPQYPQVFASAGPAGPRRLQFTRDHRGVQSLSTLPSSHPMRLRSHNVHRHAARQRLIEVARHVRGPQRRRYGTTGVHHAAPAA